MMMEGGQSSSSSGGGGGGPAPFLMKTYDMVDDGTTDEIVSWSPRKNSFVVWNPPEFARLLLPTYFKHNNFSSFIRQLNTYGFRKIDPERWEFANEDFVKDQKHLLRNIHRRKPIHSHSHPPGSLLDPEKAAFEEKIDKLSQEKASLEAHVLGFKEQRSAFKLQSEDLTQRVDIMEQRQERLLSALEKIIQNPILVDLLARKTDAMDFSAYNKKRRLPQGDLEQPVVENNFIDTNCTSRPESGDVIHQDFRNKLRLELSPAVSDVNLVSHSTQSSNEDGVSAQKKSSEAEAKDATEKTPHHLFSPETLELSDTGTSCALVDPAFSSKIPANDNPGLHPLQHKLSFDEESDGHLSCHLNLTLASSTLQVNESPQLNRIPQLSQESRKSPEPWFNGIGKESDGKVASRNRSPGDEGKTSSSLQELPNNSQEPPAAPPRANDGFWEQFLTERPGSSDTEEASSCYRANPYGEQEGRRSGHSTPRNAKNIGQLSL